MSANDFHFLCCLFPLFFPWKKLSRVGVAVEVGVRAFEFCSLNSTDPRQTRATNKEAELVINLAFLLKNATPKKKVTNQKKPE